MSKKDKITLTERMFILSVYIRNKGRCVVALCDWERGCLTVYVSDAQDKKEIVKFQDVITFEIEHKDAYICMPKEKLIWN